MKHEHDRAIVRLQVLLLLCRAAGLQRKQEGAVMITGTSYFRNLDAAIRYYRDYGFNAADVSLKIINGEIHLGLPTIKGDETLILIDNGNRWAIKD